MQATKQERMLYGDQVEILNRSTVCTQYRIVNETGELMMRSYHVFPGIDLVFSDAHISYVSHQLVERQSTDCAVLEIEHCREGRAECKVSADSFFYIAPGDVAVHWMDDDGHDMLFPLSHYHGITIQITLEQLPKHYGDFFNVASMDPAILIRQLRLQGRFFVSLQNVPEIEQIFSGLYTVPETICLDYYRLKVLELLLLLNLVDVESIEREQRSHSCYQVTLANQVQQYLAKHMQEHITTAQLAEQFKTSPSQIKNSFYGVYGVSVHQYIRTQKMQEAAKLLRDTNATVLEIAGRFGYENGSKFANAFRNVFGVSPTEYRKQ